jgi:hypothetical protein
MNSGKLLWSRIAGHVIFLVPATANRSYKDDFPA